MKQADQQLNIEQLRKELEREREARLAAEQAASSAQERLMQKDAELMRLHEQWRNEVEAQSSQVEMLARIPEELSDPFFRISANGNIQYANPACQEFLFPHLQVQLSETYPRLFQQAIEKAIISNTAVTEEFTIDNRCFLVHFSAVPIPGYINVLARDISAQKRIERRLKESEKRFRQIIETANDIIYRIKGGRITYINPIAARLTGYSKEEIQQIEFQDLIHEDYRQQISSFYQQQEQTGTPSTYQEFPLLTKDKRLIWLGQNVQLAADSPESSELIAVARDITDRKRAELQLQLTSSRLGTLISSMHTSVLVEDENRKIVLVNEQFIQLFRLEGTADSLIGLDYRSCMQNLKHLLANEVDFILQSAELLERRKPVIGEEIKTIDGRILERDYVPIIRDNKFMGHLWQYRDVTEKRNNEEALRRSKAALMEAQDQANLGSWEFSVDENRFWWSPIMQQQFGLRPEQVPADGAEFLSYFLPEDAEKVKNELMNAVDSEIKTFEARIKHPDGNLRYLQMSVRINSNEKGAIIYISGTSLDVTSQRLMQERLRASEERFQLAMKGTNDGIWDWNIIDNTIYLSPRWKGILGYQDRELDNTLEVFLQFMHPDDLDLLYKTVQQRGSLENNQLKHTFRMQHRDGSWRSVMTRGLVLYNEYGQAIRMVGANADVTEQEKAKKQLLDNYGAQRLLSDISFEFNANNDDFSIQIQESLDRLGAHTQVSRAYIFENSADNEFTSNTFEWCAEDVEPEIDRLQNQPYSAYADFRELLLKEQGIVCSNVEEQEGSLYATLSKRGIKSLIVFPILVKQELRGFVGFNERRHQRIWGASETQLLRTYANLLSNVFERQESEVMLQASEEKYRSLVDSLNEVIFQTDDRLMLNFLNPAWSVVTGYSEEESLNRPFHEFIHPEDVDDFIAMYPILFERVTDFFCQQFRILTYSGEIRWIEIYTRASLDRYNQINGFTGTFTDITERKNAEEQLIQAKETAEKASQAIAQFMSIVSHEIRTPLNAVIGITSLLQRNDPRADQLHNLNILKFSGENLLNLINDILDFNKIEAGKLELETTGFDLFQLVEHVRQAQQLKAREKGIDFQLDMDSAIPPRLIGDPTRLTQILHNLLNNAIKFTEQGHVQLRICLQERTDKDVSLKFEVEDTGIGIPEDKQNTIFHAFSQASSSTTRLFGGTGLGLSITRHLIRLHGHEIYLNSKPGEGSTFYFTLGYPLDLQASLPDQQVPVSGSAPEKALEGMRILLAEDHPVNVLVAHQYLEQWGVELRTVENGLQAIEAVKEQAFDLVLMDLQMPEMDGYQASLEIRKFYSENELPIVALSADVLQANAEKVSSFGMNDYLSKPYSSEELYRKLLPHFKRPTGRRNGADARQERPLYSLAKLEADSGGNPEFIKRIVQSFLKNSPLLLEQLEENWQAGNMSAVRKLAHTLKPSLGLLQVDSLKESIRVLEKVADKKSPEASEQLHMQWLSVTLRQVFDQLNAAFDSEPVL